MSRTFSTALSAELAKEQAAGFWLVKISMSESTHTYTDCDIDLEYAGDRYQSRGVDIQGVEQSAGFSVDTIQLDIDNVDLAISAIVLNEDAANRPVSLYYQVMSTAAVPIDTVEIFNGYINGYNLDEHRCRFELASEFMLWHKKTLRLPTPNCPWSFKGTECAYSGGSTWCDKSPDRCTDIGNYDNFGGRKFISSIENVPIYWGPK